MGVDVMLYTEDTGISDEALAVMNEALRVQGHVGWDEAPVLTRYAGVGGWIDFCSTSRLFSPYYPRGHWPTIRAQIDAMQSQFRDQPIYYGGDDGWYGEHPIWTPDEGRYLDECWRLWEASGLHYGDYDSAAWRLLFEGIQR